MRYLLAVIAIAVVLTGASVPASASLDWDWGGGTAIHSGTPGDILQYTGGLENDTDSDLYINLMEFRTPNGADWAKDYGIVAEQAWDPGSNAFAYGGRVAPGAWSTGTLLNIRTNDGYEISPMQKVHVDTPAGTYNADVVFRGGASPTAVDELYTLHLAIEIVSDYGFHVSTKDPNQVGVPGETKTFSHVYTNNSDRTVYYNSLWTDFDPLDSANITHAFTFAWPTEIRPGQTVESSTFEMKISEDAPPSLNAGGSGYWGGYYPGDYHAFDAGHWSLEVVPEPGSLLAMSAGLLSLMGIGGFKRLTRK